MSWYVKHAVLVWFIFQVNCSAPVDQGDPTPCAIVLAAHAGEDEEDRNIVRLQEKADSAARPLPYLERLGWAFVAEARATYDPGFYKLAEQCALCMETKEPGTSEALLLHGHVLHNLHRFEEAESVARELVAARGLSYDYGLLGDVLLERGKLDEAIEAYQEMMDQKPSPQAYSRSAHARWLKGDLPGAMELMRMAAGASGSVDPESGAWAHARLALFELQAGRPDEASRLVAGALVLRRDYAPALLARGRILLAQGDPAKAVPSLEQAARLNPLPEYQWVLLEALVAAGLQEEAELVETQLMERGAWDDPRTFSLYLATTGKNAAAALTLAEQELGVRADIFTMDALAWALHASGRQEEALKLSARTLAEGTKDARLFLHAGIIASRSGETGEARRFLERAEAIQQMLLPSEKRRLREELETLIGSERRRT